MSRSATKKTHKQRWDEAQREMTARDWAGSNPYRITRRETHPYDPNNPNNPYASPRISSSEMSEKPKRQQSSHDNPSEIKSG